MSDKPMVIVTDVETLSELIDAAVQKALEARTEPSPGPVALDAKEAAALLNVTSRTVTTLANAGKLPATKIGTIWRFRRQDVLAFLEPDAA